MPVAAQNAYDVSVAELLKLGHELHATPSQKFDLAHMRVLLEAMGRPERRFPSVLIANAFRFGPAQLWEIQEPAEREVVNVNLKM